MKSFKVNTSGTNRKPYAIYILSHIISKISWIIGQVFCVDRGLPVLNTFVRSKPLNLRLRYLALINYRHRFMVWCKAYLDILNRLGVSHECDGQTDRDTDRRTDGQTCC